MHVRLGIVMDPIDRISFKKDSSLAMLLSAQSRGWSLFYMEQQDLYQLAGQARARMRSLQVFDNPQHWFELGDELDEPLSDLTVILMRKDPPFDNEFVYSTYLLEQAEAAGSLVVNSPQSLRDCNEKLFATMFPQCTPATLVSRRPDILREFAKQQRDIILKPLDGMGGSSIFRHREDDPNLSVILETLTAHGTQQIMAQQYLPAIKDGDKRILMIDGEPVPYCLARIPAAGETRGNLAAGGRGEARPLTDKDRWIAEQVGPELRKRGLLFVGLVQDTKVNKVQVESSEEPTPVVQAKKQVISTPTPQKQKVQSAAQVQPKPQPTKPRPVIDREQLSADIASLEAELALDQQKYAKRPRVSRQNTAATKRDISAWYREDWRKKVERVGNLNYPDEARRQGIYGSLRVLVIIKSDGSLENMRILESSGHPVLDRAALNIVRTAAPFAPFTGELAANYDQVEIIRTWRFERGDRLSSQ